MMYLPMLEEADIWSALHDIRVGRATYADAVALGCALGPEKAREFNPVLKRICAGMATIADADALEKEFSSSRKMPSLNQTSQAAA